MRDVGAVRELIALYALHRSSLVDIYAGGLAIRRSSSCKKANAPPEEDAYVLQSSIS